MTRKVKAMDGIRLKVRTSADGAWLVATLWVDGVEPRELSRIDKAMIADAGDVFQEWVDVCGRLMNSVIERAAGIEGLTIKREKPNYSGEPSDG